MSYHLNAANANLTWKRGQDPYRPGLKPAKSLILEYVLDRGHDLERPLLLLFPCQKPNHRLSTHTSNLWVALFQVRLSDIRIAPVFLRAGNVREIYIGSPLSFKYDLRLHISVSPVYLI
jgi:hypothetical protein